MLFTVGVPGDGCREAASLLWTNTLIGNSTVSLSRIVSCSLCYVNDVVQISVPKEVVFNFSWIKGKNVLFYMCEKFVLSGKVITIWFNYFIYDSLYVLYCNLHWYQSNSVITIVTLSYYITIVHFLMWLIRVLQSNHDITFGKLCDYLFTVLLSVLYLYVNYNNSLKFYFFYIVPFLHYSLFLHFLFMRTSFIINVCVFHPFFPILYSQGRLSASSKILWKEITAVVSENWACACVEEELVFGIFALWSAITQPAVLALLLCWCWDNMQPTTNCIFNDFQLENDANLTNHFEWWKLAAEFEVSQFGYRNKVDVAMKSSAWVNWL